MKIGSFDTSSITSSISNAVSSVEQKVEAKIDSAVSTVKQAEAKVENFAKSEYEEVKDYAKATGQKIEQKFEAAVDTAKQVAHEIPSFKVPQGVKDLGKKIFGDSAPAAPKTEGGANLNVKNGGASNEKVDLNDKQKFLEKFGQKDATDDTKSDGARCQSNTIIAGLLMKGGPDEVKKGLNNALTEAKKQKDAETDPGRKLALERAVTNLQSAISGIESKNLTRGQMDRASDALFTVMVPAKDAKGNTNFDAKGDPAGDPNTGITGVDKDKIRDMEKTVGLTDGSEAKKVGESWFAPLTDDNREVSDNVWDSIKPGQSAHVGVNLYGESKVTRKDEYGGDVKTNSRNDLDYDSHDNLIDRQANHAVLFGRNADGTRYIYNPIGDPPYITETKGDKASSEKFDQMSTALMAVKQGKKASDNDWQADVTSYGG